MSNLIFWAGIVGLVFFVYMINLVDQNQIIAPKDIVANAVTAPISDVEREQLFTEAKNLHDVGNYQAAIDIYDALIKKDTTSVDPYLRKAHTYRYWGKYPEAEAAFLKAKELDPTNAWTWTELGKLYRNMGRYEESESALLRSLELEPNNEITYSYGLGYLYKEMGRFEEAETAFKTAIKINPKTEIAYAGLGDLYRELGRFEESEAYFNMAFNIDPNSEGIYGLGLLYLKQKRYNEAIEVLSTFLENIREKGEVYNALGDAYLGNGQKLEAREAFVKSVELNPGNEYVKRKIDDL